MQVKLSKHSSGVDLSPYPLNVTKYCTVYIPSVRYLGAVQSLLAAGGPCQFPTRMQTAPSMYVIMTFAVDAGGSSQSRDRAGRDLSVRERVGLKHGDSDGMTKNRIELVDQDLFLWTPNHQGIPMHPVNLGGKNKGLVG